MKKQLKQTRQHLMHVIHECLELLHGGKSDYAATLMKNGEKLDEVLEKTKSLADFVIYDGKTLLWANTFEEALIKGDEIFGPKTGYVVRDTTHVIKLGTTVGVKS